MKLQVRNLLVLGTVPSVAALIGAATDGTTSMSEFGEHLVLAATDSVVITTDGNWTYYEYADPLSDAYQLTYRGEPDGAGGCAFSGEEVITPNVSGSSDEVLHEREIATNLADCVMRTERGIQTWDDPGPPPGYVEEEEVAEPSEEPGVNNGPLAVYQRTAWHKTYYEDPLQLDVNSARTRVTWTYNGTCVLNSWNHGTSYGWLEQSGWWKSSSSTTAWRGCSYARTTSYSRFLNFIFCDVTKLTTTEYWPNRIKGLPDGRWANYWQNSKSGDCAWLLSFHRSTGWS